MKLTVFILFLNLASSVLAQKYVDILKVHYLEGLPVEFDSSSVKTNFREVGVNLTVPIKLSKKTALITGVQTETYRFKLNENFNKELKLYSAGFQLGINYKFNDSWSSTIGVIPRLTSSFSSNVSIDDYQTIAFSMFKFGKKEHLKYNFGLIYISDLGGPFFVPLLGMYYLSPSKKFEMNLVLPLWADFNYSLTSIFVVGANFKSYLRSFNLSENDNYLTLLSSELNAYLRFNITKSLFVESKIGASFLRTAREFELGDQYKLGVSAIKIGDNRTQLNSDFNNGIIFKLRLVYRYHL